MTQRAQALYIVESEIMLSHVVMISKEKSWFSGNLKFVANVRKYEKSRIR